MEQSFAAVGAHSELQQCAAGAATGSELMWDVAQVVERHDECMRQSGTGSTGVDRLVYAQPARGFEPRHPAMVDVCKRTGGMQHTAKLTPNRYGAYCYDGDNKKPVRNPRQSGETGNLRDADGRSAAGMTLTSTPTCSRRRIDTFRPDSRTTARVT